MIQIEIFTSKSDKHYIKVRKEIAKAIKSSKIKSQVSVKALDVQYAENAKLLEGYIKQIEKKFGATENPVKAVPLVVINNKPIIVGMNPKFKNVIKAALMECEVSEQKTKRAYS